MLTKWVGFGPTHFQLAIYIANRPVNPPYPVLNHLQALGTGELQHIVANNSNHWRKVFNVYAKLIWQLDHVNLKGTPLKGVSTWQAYRDQHLLQAHSREALLFSPPNWRDAQVKVITGKTYAASLPLPPLVWLDAHFAINHKHRIIVSPYLDYRQLSNARIDKLVELIKALNV
ncbi:MAG TPA: hypothetical protein VIC26_06815 [Marinagarivorans sp.]